MDLSLCCPPRSWRICFYVGVTTPRSASPWHQGSAAGTPVLVRLNQPGVPLEGEAGPCSRPFDEGITNCHAVGGAAVLHVLGIDRVVTGLDGGGRRPPTRHWLLRKVWCRHMSTAYAEGGYPNVQATPRQAISKWP